MAATENPDNSVFHPRLSGTSTCQDPETSLFNDVSTTTITWTWIEHSNSVGPIRTYSINRRHPEIQRRITDGAVKLLREVESAKGNSSFQWRSLLASQKSAG